jgi:hypothetical protein
MMFSRSFSSGLAIACLLGCGDGNPDGEAPGEDPDGDCLTDAEEQQRGTDPRSPDSDADGIGDCDEIQAGTSPLLADTDGDGLTDPTEVACVSDPLDAAQKCYACGWKHNDPGNLVSTGRNEGDVIGNMQLVDQCLEPVSLWDFAATPDSPEPEPARYYILLMSAAW